MLLEWAPGSPREEFLRGSLSDSTSALVVIGERMLSAEFPGPESARAALEAVGHGERSFTALSNRSGLGATSLNRALSLLRDKRVVAADDPLSTARGGRATRYRVADPYLRYWLRFVGPALAGWPAFRGRAVEPVVRQALERLTPLPGLGPTRDFGGFWTRSNDIEVDLVGVADRGKVGAVTAVGSVKWRDSHPFDADDAAALRRIALAVPGVSASSALLAVSRAGFTAGVGPLRQFGPDDLLRAWTPSAGS